MHIITNGPEGAFKYTFGPDQKVDVEKINEKDIGEIENLPFHYYPYFDVRDMMNWTMDQAGM